MQVDFYHLDSEPVAGIASQLAGKVFASGERLLIMGHAEQLPSLSEALWRAGGFLAHGIAGGEDDARQPILLSDQMIAPNGARMVLFADGQWRDPGDGFVRVMLLFNGDTIAGARIAWRQLGEGITRNYWKRQGGRWVKGP